MGTSDLKAFGNDSRILLDTSALLAAANSSDELNHFLEDLLKKKASSGSQVVVPESAVKLLAEKQDEDFNHDRRKAAKRALSSLLDCVKSGEIHVVKDHAVRGLEGWEIPICAFLRDQSISLRDSHPVYVVTNDREKAKAIYRIPPTATGHDITVCEVLDDGGYKLFPVVLEPDNIPTLKPVVPAPSPKPAPTPEPAGEPTPEPAPVIDAAEEARRRRQEEIDRVIRIDPEAMGRVSPGVVYGTDGKIKVPHR